MIKNKRWFWIVAVLLAITIVATIVHNPKSPGNDHSGTSSSLALPPSLAVKAFKIGDGWGYDIIVDGQPFIHQDQIPGLPGQVQFISQDEAMKCGEFVLSKILNNQAPSVGRAELDSLKITYQLPHD